MICRRVWICGAVQVVQWDDDDAAAAAGLLESGRLLAKYLALMLEVYEGGGDSRPIRGVFSQREFWKLAF